MHGGEQQRTEARGNPLTFTDAAGNMRTMVSDAAGRVLSMTDASGNPTSFTFDAMGNRLTSTDAAGKTSSFSYDKKGRLASATDSSGHTTSTQYDGNGNAVARTDAKGSTTTFGFNKGNQLVKTVDPLGKTVRQGYCADVGCPSCGGGVTPSQQSNLDTAGSGGGSSGVCFATDALGNTTVTRFDPLGRATETISPTAFTGNGARYKGPCEFHRRRWQFADDGQRRGGAGAVDDGRHGEHDLVHVRCDGQWCQVRRAGQGPRAPTTKRCQVRDKGFEGQTPARDTYGHCGI